MSTSATKLTIERHSRHMTATDVGESVAMRQESKARILEYDFVKGTLVVLMVLYHWLNYFGGSHSYYYRYLRFITPSFIFITGFLISVRYFARQQSDSSDIALRLAHRGVKLFALFIALNIGVSFVVTSGNTKLELVSHVWNSFLGVNPGEVGSHAKLVSFYILIPIAYLLLLSAMLLVARKRCRRSFEIACALCLVGICILAVSGMQNSMLEMLTIGLLGTMTGYLPAARISSYLSHRIAFFAIYACYIVSVTLWNVVYPLQVVGVVLNVGLLYMVATNVALSFWLSAQAILLGRYSLFGYIVQIAWLQLLHRWLGGMDIPAAGLTIVLVAAIILTVASVRAVHVVRQRSEFVNQVYSAVFS
jgi:peptidoglycan/LPS O-acetylase OafA/YrhL